MDGAIFRDAPGHSISRSNGLPTSKVIFDWIRAHEKTFYLPRSPIDPIGVYFSPETRNYYANEFIPSYRGILILLMQKHLEFQVVTPRTLQGFHGRTLVLPDVRALSSAENDWLNQLEEVGGRSIISGTDTTEVGESHNVVRLANDPGKSYNERLEKDFEHTSPEAEQG